MPLLPLARGRRGPTGRMRGLTWSEYEPENNALFPPHPSPLPRGKRVKLENQLRGRGDNRKKIHNIVSHRVKYKSTSCKPGERSGVSPPSQMRATRWADTHRAPECHEFVKSLSND